MSCRNWKIFEKKTVIIKLPQCIVKAIQTWETKKKREREKMPHEYGGIIQKTLFKKFSCQFLFVL